MFNKPIRVILTDDHAIVRIGISALLATVEDIRVIGEACNGAEAVKLADTLHPDVILMDLVMAEMDGIEATRQITLKHPDIKVLVLTSFAADEKVFPAIKAGALGYLLKDSDPEALIHAIYDVYRGEPSLDPSIARKVLLEISHPPQAAVSTDPLTDREMEVLRLIAQGLNNREIADQLVIAELTVRSHVSSILSKLHLASRTQAALFAIKSGLASLDDVPGLKD